MTLSVIRDPKPGAPDAVIAIGSFDGVHLGHRALLARVVDEARALGAVAAVLTFEPLPREFLVPGARAAADIHAVGQAACVRRGGNRHRLHLPLHARVRGPFPGSLRPPASRAARGAARAGGQGLPLRRAARGRRRVPRRRGRAPGLRGGDARHRGRRGRARLLDARARGPGRRRPRRSPPGSWAGPTPSAAVSCTGRSSGAAWDFPPRTSLCRRGAR